MRLNIYCSLVAVFIFIYGCSEKDPNMKLKNLINKESKITYSVIGKDGFYKFDENISTNKYKRFDVGASNNILIDTAMTDTVSYKDFENKAAALLYRITNTIQIEKIDSNIVYLIKKRKTENDNFNVDDEWQIKCEITKGSKAAFEKGETIEVREMDATEYNNAYGVLFNAMETFKWKSYNNFGYYYDPTKTQVKYDTKKHIFFISKNKIEELLDFSIEQNVVLVKATKKS